MRVKLGLLSTVIALCLGQAYSAEVQNEVKQTQETEFDVNKSIQECRDHLKDIISATEELSEKNIELLGMLANTYFKGIEDFTKTNTEDAKQLLLLGSNIFAADKMLNEIADTYVDNNSYERNDTTDKIELVHNNLKGIAKEFENMSSNLKNAVTIIPTNERKLQLVVMNILHMYLNIKTKFSSVLHKLYMLKADIILKSCTQIESEIKKANNGILKLEREVEDFERKLEKRKQRRKRHIPPKTTENTKSSSVARLERMKQQLMERRLTSDEIIKPKLILPAKKTEVEKEEAK